MKHMGMALRWPGHPDSRLVAVEHFGGNRAATAKALGIGETTLWQKLKSYGLIRGQGRQ